jgi:dynein heavy chain
VIQVKVMDENNRPRPIRGSPCKPTFTKTAKNRANQYTGPLVSQWVSATLKGLDEFYQTTNVGHQIKLKDGDVKSLINVMNHIKNMVEQEDSLIRQQDEVFETLQRLEQEGVGNDKQLKQLKKIGSNLQQLKADCLAKEKEIQPMQQKESELYRKKIAEFEQDLKEYQSKLPKAEFYFYKSGLELARQRLESGSESTKQKLMEFDLKLEDLHHIASSFSYPEELANSRKCIAAMHEEVAAMA